MLRQTTGKLVQANMDADIIILGCQDHFPLDQEGPCFTRKVLIEN